MSLTEQKKRKEIRIHKLELLFAERYEQMHIHNMLCFCKEDGTIFHVVDFPEKDAILIEYAENYDEAMIYRFEDGDRFYLDEMNEDEMFRAMLHEIEQ